MAVLTYFGWGLLAPAALSLLSGWTAGRAMALLGYRETNTIWERIRLPLFLMLLFVIWSITGFPLPILYVLVFLAKLLMTKDLFIVNISHLLFMALHMILISAAALVTFIPINELLQNAWCRIAVSSTILAADILLAVLIPKWKLLPHMVRTQQQSEEIAPFMMFLWFCNVFLFLDSILCVTRIDWPLLPLFLLGSTLLTEFYLIRFLRHLFIVIKVKYLESEHERLIEKLQLQKQEDEKIRSRSEQDSLTGIFSRWYATERIEYLLKEQMPFSLIYIDLDHLKQINDKEGHQAGDHYLKHFADALGRFLRDTDTFARIGGDEFIVLLPECEEKTAIDRMKNIQSRLCEDFIPPLPFSFGVVFVSDGYQRTVEQILHMADQAMYIDKNTRR